MRYFQTKIITPPVINPAIAPCLFDRFQKSERSTTGPNEAPKPAHANETIWNTELSGSLAMNMEMIEIMTTVSFAIITEVLSLSFFFPYVCSKSCEMLDADAR